MSGPRAGTSQAEHVALVVETMLLREVERAGGATVDEALLGAMVTVITLAVARGGRGWAMDLILDAAHAVRHSPTLADLDLACTEPAGRA